MQNTTPIKTDEKGFVLVIEAPKSRIPSELLKRMRSKTQPNKKKVSRVNQKKEWEL